MSDLQLLEQKLDSFSPTERAEALRRLLNLRLPAPPASENVNMHFHSFFSFNAEGWSPTHIAWAARRAGLYAAGLCDFDVLDGLEEFLAAGASLGLRVAVHLETRVFLKEYADVEITSPGEPGVTYIMGAGFAQVPQSGPQASGLRGYRQRARARNEALIQRINAHLPRVAVEYERDVLPLTPLGGATERHLIRAYLNRSLAVCGTPADAAGFWAGILGKRVADVEQILHTPAMEEAVRARLVKRGGLGYVQPSEDTFPPADEFIAWVRSCGAIPTITWLDGTTAGERDPRALLEFLVAKGCAALNIIPERNWNLPNPEERARKVVNLRAVVAEADALGLPILIGTEMNRGGLPFVDDLAGPVLREFKSSFQRGARILVGHTLLSRFAGHSYVTAAGSRSERNAFFEAVGALPPLDETTAEKLAGLEPERAYAVIAAAVRAGAW